MTAPQSKHDCLREALRRQAAHSFTEGLDVAERASTALLSSACIPDDERRIIFAQTIAELNLADYPQTHIPPNPDPSATNPADSTSPPNLTNTSPEDAVAVGCTPVTRAIQLFRRDSTAPVSRRDQERCVSICAWSCAICFMFVAIGFLFSEFFESRSSPALTSRLLDAKELELPIITFCTAVPALPAFATFPQPGFQGTALFGARMFQNKLTGERKMWPATHANRTVRTVALGPPAHCARQLSEFSFAEIARSLRSLRKEELCHTCFQLGAFAPIAVPKLNYTRRARGVVQIEFSFAREIAFCIVPSVAMIDYIRRNIMEAVKKNGRALMRRGVLQLNGTDDIDFALDNAFNQLRRRSDNRYNLELGAFLCNVYFASGFFYPKPPGTDIVYRNDFDSGFWAPVGRGPYHRIGFAASAGAGDGGGSGGDGEAADEMSSKKTLLDTLLVFAHDPGQGPVPDYTDSLGTLNANKKKSYLLSKTLSGKGGKYVGFAVESRSGPLILDIVRERFRIFTSSFDFRHFGIDVESRQPSMSVMELITNIFEYTGLFTGVCVYSILVGPARFYLKRTKARRQSNVPAAGG